MAKLIVTRGLPASGKTTYAKHWVAEDPSKRARINRDDIRRMLNDGVYIKGETEARVISLRDKSINYLLRKGMDVINDDTNLSAKNMKDLILVASDVGADFELVDLTDVSLVQCITWNDSREGTQGHVPTEVILDFHRRYLKGRELPLPVPQTNPTGFEGPDPYTPKEGTPKAIIVDIDGTVALHNGRDPYNTDICDKDLPNGPVITAVQHAYLQGYKIIFVSGRNDGSYDMTYRWLEAHVGPIFDGLYMRSLGDERADFIIKTELFDTFVRNNYDVEYVLDDRNTVVKNWRDMGLTVFQVAEGDF